MTELTGLPAIMAYYFIIAQPFVILVLILAWLKWKIDGRLLPLEFESVRLASKLERWGCNIGCGTLLAIAAALWLLLLVLAVWGMWHPGTAS